MGTEGEKKQESSCCGGAENTCCCQNKGAIWVVVAVLIVGLVVFKACGKPKTAEPQVPAVPAAEQPAPAARM
jgi:hypothetical protein